MPLTATGPKLYGAPMTNVLYHYYASLVKNLNHLKSLKPKDYPGENDADFCDVILVDAERLEGARDYNTKHLGYIVCIFADNFDSIFHLWAAQNYKYVMELLRNSVCVTKISCDLMISLPMVTLVNKLFANTTKLLTQSIGNPRMVRKIIRIRLYFWRLPL